MDQKVINLREAEYQAIMARLKRMHSDQLTEIRMIMANIKMMATSEGFFLAELTSNRVSEILDTISSDMINLLEQTFQDSETSIEDMIQGTITADSVCG